MSTREIKSERTGERYLEVDHPSGLKIVLYPKEGYTSTYAVFGTKYGSIDRSFKKSGDEKAHEVPAGIAHFLEHKLFESEDGDAFEKYAKTGASANAYTSFDATCYLFSCTENLMESLEILMNFVQNPYFTAQTVEKEQGIIGQEIRMYDDDPQWRVMFNLLGALYHNHPVKIDIAGSVESIAEINADLLYDCYKTFYNLGNMMLCVAGNFDADEVLALADKVLKPAEPIEIERIFPDEPKEVAQKRVEQKLAVSVPLFQFGFKEQVSKERLSAKDAALTEILLEIIASKSSPLFRRLLDEGLVNTNTFGTEYFEGPGYASVIFSGESKDPDKVAEAIVQEADRLRNEGIDEQAFERAKKAVYGRNLSALNSTDNIANAVISLSFAGRELFAYIDEIANADLASVKSRLQNQMQGEYSALSVIYPNK